MRTPYILSVILFVFSFSFAEVDQYTGSRVLNEKLFEITDGKVVLPINVVTTSK